MKNPKNNGLLSSLWINGRSSLATMIWISETHAELITDEADRLQRNRLTALVVRDFLSLPSRVEVKDERHVVLRFVQRPHASVVDLLRSELIAEGTDLAREAMEEAAIPSNAMADIEAWDDNDLALEMCAA